MCVLGGLIGKILEIAAAKVGQATGNVDDIGRLVDGHLANRFGGKKRTIGFDENTVVRCQ